MTRIPESALRGRDILIVGNRGGGKSTMAAHLLRSLPLDKCDGRIVFSKDPPFTSAVVPEGTWMFPQADYAMAWRVIHSSLLSAGCIVFDTVDNSDLWHPRAYRKWWEPVKDTTIIATHHHILDIPEEVRQNAILFLLQTCTIHADQQWEVCAGAFKSRDHFQSALPKGHHALVVDVKYKKYYSYGI